MPHTLPGATMIVGLIMVVIVLAVAGTGDRVLLQTVIEAEIRLILVISLFMFTGNSGVVSFVHVGFMMLGAYVTAWLTMDQSMKSLFLPGLPSLLAETSLSLPFALTAGCLVAGLAALASGLVICRLSGIGASIASFALFMALYALFRQASGWTAGQSSLVGLPVRLDAMTGLAGVAIAVVVASIHERSNWGLTLRASREDEVAARSCAVEVESRRLAAFVLSACIAGLAGGLYSQFLGLLTVDMFYLDATFIALAMLMIGGWGSLAGAMTGSIAVSIAIFGFERLEKGIDVAGNRLAFAPGMAEVAIGLAMIVFLIWRPQGLLGKAG